MAYFIYKVEDENIGKAKGILNKDPFSRQSQVVRISDGVGYILFEGDEEIVNDAKEQLKEEGLGAFLEGEEEKKRYDEIKEEEESASMGMGALFG